MTFPAHDGVYRDEDGVLWDVQTYDGDEQGPQRRASRLEHSGPFLDDLVGPLEGLHTVQEWDDAGRSAPDESEPEVTPTDHVAYAFHGLEEALRSLPPEQTGEATMLVRLPDGRSLFRHVLLHPQSWTDSRGMR